MLHSLHLILSTVTAYLNTVEDSNMTWNTTMLIDEQEGSFKIDTGAEVTVISDKSLDSLSVIELQSSTKGCVAQIEDL